MRHDPAILRASAKGRRRGSGPSGSGRARSLAAGLVCLSTLLAPLRPAGADEPAPVRVATAVSADAADTLRLSGTVTARQSAGLSPRVSGLVTAVHVDAGDRIDAGDVLLDIDPALARLHLRQAEAALREGEAQLAESRRLHREAAQLVAERHLPETEVHARAAAIELAAATAARLEADVRSAAELLERHALVAPFAGVISARRTEAGEWVETGTAVLDLVDTDHIRLDVQVPQERFGDIDADTSVRIHLDGTAEQSFPGRVIARVPVNDPAARSFLVRVGLAGDDAEQRATRRLIPGMSAIAVFALASAENAVAVPRDALVRADDGSFRVWLVDRSGDTPRVHARAVRVGRSLAARVEVRDGLVAGDVVVVRGNESLREGQAVDVREDAAAPG
jgi:RND family efflux transporter MFP subunit